MIGQIISFTLKHKLFVVIGVAVLVMGGIFAYRKLSVDAFPDVTNVQIQIITELPGRSPEEVEKLVTYPIEIQMMGIPKLSDMRSLSKFGLSMVTVVFEDNVDIYFARQLVLERLIEAKDKLPAGSEPKMGPITTGLGEIYQYTLEKSQLPPSPSLVKRGRGGAFDDLMDLRTIQNWVVRPMLRGVPGVTDVNSFGGWVKQYQVVADPDKLRKFDITLRELFEAVSKNNRNAGGNVIERHSEQYIVRGVGLITSLTDLGNIVVKVNRGTPIYVRDVAEVKFGPEMRQGAVVKDGKGEAVAGIVMMLRGSSGKEVVADVKKKVREVNSGNILPAGVKIKPFYDRTELVDKCIETVTKALEEGAVLVVIVLYLFLRNIRGAVVVAVTLPLAVLATFIIMWKVGLSANLMSLGGLAISIGMIVDSAVIQVENVLRHFSHKEKSVDRDSTVLGAVLEVIKPSLFGQLIIALTFIPIMTFQGMEGKMFAPLAFTIVIALFASLLLSVLVTPVLTSLLLKEGEEKESFIIRFAKWLYIPMLKRSIRNNRTVIIASTVVLAGTLALAPYLGTEFIPVMDEGSLSPQIIRLPSISLSESIEVEKKVQQALLKFPEVETVVSKIGSAELATDPMGPNLSDPVVILKPRKEWTSAGTKEELVQKIRDELVKIPGIGFNISQPIALRVDELISGVKSQLAIKLFGDDMNILKEKAEEMAKVLSGVKGVADLRVEQTFGQPYLTIDINRNEIARYGINVEDVQEIVETAIGGKSATEVLEGDRRFSVFMRFPEANRNSVQSIENILVRASNGSNVPLAQLAKVSISDGPVQISREGGKRRIVIECNVVGRDIGGFVTEAQTVIEKNVKFPSGYRIMWGGAFENQQRAMKRLSVIVPVVIVLIYFLLFISFNSFKYAGLIMLTLPFALIGGILGLFVTGFYLSVPASVGFIALFGVAVLNGLVLVSCINKLREDGLGLEEALIAGCEMRLRPVLMTALIAILGLLPMLFATGPGSEVQKPLAVVVVGGLVTSTLLTLLVLPALYKLFERSGAAVTGTVDNKANY